MKQSGLRNRFSSEVRHVWLYWYSCMFCGQNQQDVLHHILSPSVRDYVDGNHNTSVFNSAPLHNFKCHIGNEAWLGHNVRHLLNKVARSLLWDVGYTPNKLDLVFIHTYRHLYEDDILSKLSIK
jgi:hypothetical protein